MKNLPDPCFGNIFLDANALDRIDKQRSDLVDQFQRLAEELELNIVNPSGVQKEIDNMQTPRQTQMDMSGIYTIKVPLNHHEFSIREKLRQVMSGNAQSSKHYADADHLFEASKYGRYFITHDRRIRMKQLEIVKLFPGLNIVELHEFVKICLTRSKCI